MFIVVFWFSGFFIGFAVKHWLCSTHRITCYDRSPSHSSNPHSRCNPSESNQPDRSKTIGDW